MRGMLGLVAVTLGAAVLASTAAADAVYHTERLELAGLAGTGRRDGGERPYERSAGVRARDLHASRCRSGHVPGDPQRLPDEPRPWHGSGLPDGHARYQREATGEPTWCSRRTSPDFAG